jgi:hypothetical protein
MVSNFDFGFGVNHKQLAPNLHVRPTRVTLPSAHRRN